jgi:hypothetical protein
MPEPLVPEDLSEKQLKWGYWFVTHKILLKRILIITLIAMNAAFFGFSGYGLVSDLMNAPARRQMVDELGRNLLNPLLSEQRAAKPLTIANPQVLSSKNAYDFVTQVTNPNQDFFAHFSYRFVAGSFMTEFKSGFILPGERKYLSELGVLSPKRPSSASLEISGLAWRRVNKHEIPDWQDFAHQHLNLPITDVVYVPGIEIIRDKPTIGRTSFTIANDTGYGYYGLRLLVLMYRGPTLAAVNSVIFQTIGPGEKKAGEVTWYEDYGAVTEIKVVPEIDITDQSVYIRTPG